MISVSGWSCCLARAGRPGDPPARQRARHPPRLPRLPLPPPSLGVLPPPGPPLHGGPVLLPVRVDHGRDPAHPVLRRAHHGNLRQQPGDPRRSRRWPHLQDGAD